MIVRDEESQLRTCIEPVATLFDEIIVVDTGSRDGTRQLAAELGAKVFEFAWCDDFAAARNASIENATGDWIFWLDADDRLDADNIERLKCLFESLGDENRAYIMTCLSLPQYDVDPAQVLPHCRLFRRHPKLRWSHRVHEQILAAVECQGHEVVGTDIRIQHVGSRNPVLSRRKANRNLRLLRLDYAIDPTNPVTLYNLGTTYHNLGEAGEALTYLLSSLKHVDHSADWVRGLFAVVGDVLANLGRREEALAILSQGLTRFPHDSGLLTRRAALLSQVGDLGGAEQCLLKLLRAPQENCLTTGCEKTIDRREARWLLGSVYQEQGRFREGERVFQELLAEYPEYVQAWVGLGHIYLAQRRHEDVEYVSRQLEKCRCGAAYAAFMRAEGCMDRGEMKVARELIDKAIELAPRMVWPRLVLAEWLEESGAPLNDCIAAHRDVLRMSPGNAFASARIDALMRRDSLGQGVSVPLWTSIIA